MELKRWNGLLATNASRMEAKLAYISLNTQTPCRPTFNAEQKMQIRFDGANALSMRSTEAMDGPGP